MSDNATPYPYAMVDAHGRVHMHGMTLETPVIDGLIAVDSRPPDLGHYWEAGVWVPMPTQPSPDHVFDYATKQWEDPRTLDDLRATAHAAIERWRDQQENAGFTFTHAGHEWDGGLVVRQRLQPVLGLAALPDGFFWTDADNSDVPISMPALQSLSAAHEQALVLRGFEIHARRRAMKAKIEAMDRAALLAFAPGWPPA